MYKYHYGQLVSETLKQKDGIVYETVYHAGNGGA